MPPPAISSTKCRRLLLLRRLRPFSLLRTHGVHSPVCHGDEAARSGSSIASATWPPARRTTPSMCYSRENDITKEGSVYPNLAACRLAVLHGDQGPVATTTAAWALHARCSTKYPCLHGQLCSTKEIQDMASSQMVRMNQGQGETSYARNSSIQSAQQNRMKPMIEAVIVDLCSSINNTSTLFPRKMLIADLGCSSGPNALALVSIAVEAIHNHCLQFQQPSPEVCVLLNDLPENDFNMLVKSLVTLRQSNKHVVVTGITPGSFYERLFTSGSLHLICSSNSLQWLSKAPEHLTRNQIPAYDIDEHARRERLPMVLEAYAQQFRNDFTLFLKLRAKELVSGGRMVVSLIGRPVYVIASKFFHLWEIIAQILSVMTSEGLIDKAKFDSFYVPLYGPSCKELKEIIQEEGSFSIREMQEHDPTTDYDSALMTPSRFLNHLRAIFEPIIVQHFGEVMDEFTRTGELRWSLEGSMQEERARNP